MPPPLRNIRSNRLFNQNLNLINITNLQNPDTGINHLSNVYFLRFILLIRPLGLANAPKREQFDLTIDAVGKIRKGDMVTLDFVPTKGMVFSLNGVVKGQTIPGADFYAGLLRIFIGDKPVDQKLKTGLLSLTDK